ncbi:MAG: transposase [Phycisphaerales bacterium]
MTLSRRDPQRSFFDVSFLAENLFDATDPYSLFRREILPALEAQRETLCAMYCADNGRPAIEPVLVAGVTLLQFMEKAPDRQAVERLRFHLGWKHALGLAVDYAGFHATSLVYFRQRLLENDGSRCVFDAILHTLEGKGLVPRRGKQRLDSTHILGLVSSMSRLETTRETLRLFLQMLERRQRLAEAPGWELLRERYLDSEIPWRQLTKETLAEKFRQAGRDMQALIAWVEGQTTWDEQDKTSLLRRVFGEQFEVVAAQPQVRQGECSGAVKNPHDSEAQWAAKDTDKKTAWVGYKVQIAETVPEEAMPKAQGEPTSQFLTEVTTTEAITSDLAGRERVERQQEQHGLGRADTLYVDTAYVTDDALGQAEQENRQLMGPARGSCNTSGALFTAEAFDVSIAERRAICPAGHASTQCSRLENQQTGQVDYRFEWSYHCDDCPLRSQCTNARSGRRMLVVGRYHDLLQARRREMKTDEFHRQMHQRKAIEGTISEFVRNGGRRTRYRGLAKTSLANYLHGAAINAKRWIRLLQYRMSPNYAALL